jgi:hypothetical protein
MGGKICLTVVQMLETQSGPKWRASKYIHGFFFLFFFYSSIDPAHDGPAITGNKEIYLDCECKCKFSQSLQLALVVEDI